MEQIGGQFNGGNGMKIYVYKDTSNKYTFTTEKSLIPTETVPIDESNYNEIYVPYTEHTVSGEFKVDPNTGQVIPIGLNEVKNNMISKLSNITKNHIERFYPDIKQKSDLSDKEYFETYMKIHNTDEIAFRQAIAQAVQNIYNNASDFATELANLQANFPAPATTDIQTWNLAIEQLFKIAIRVYFVQMCKNIYRQYKQQIESATDETQLPDLSTIEFPQLPL